MLTAICILVPGHSRQPKSRAEAYCRVSLSWQKNRKVGIERFHLQKRQLAMTTAVKGAKVMKTSNNDALDQVLYIWFFQCWGKNIPVTGPILMKKASVYFQ